jgi:hypothetical protein
MSEVSIVDITQEDYEKVMGRPYLNDPNQHGFLPNERTHVVKPKRNLFKLLKDQLGDEVLRASCKQEEYK